MQTKLNDGSVMISGFLSKDAEYRQVGDKKSSLTKFSVKVGERDGNAIWVNCQCWHSAARACKNLKKFDVVLCIGKVEKNTYTKNDGTQGTDVHLTCEAVFVQPQAASEQAQQVTQSVNGYEDLLTDDGTPF